MLILEDHLWLRNCGLAIFEKASSVKADEDLHGFVPLNRVLP
jgi:hypothetical protein